MRARRSAARAAAVLAISMAMLAASCSSSDDASPAGTTIDPGGAVTSGSESGPPDCPSGTTLEVDLCVASGPEAQQAADLVRTTFVDEQLGAVILGVWKGDQPLLVGAVGETLTGVPATVDMHHRAGNISNGMLQTVLLQQVDAGTISLSDKLSTWYPELPAADEITVEMLARSTTGYRHYTELDSFQKAFYDDPFKAWDVDDVIAYGVAGGPLYPPGTSWNFSDTNFLILGQVIEKATGKPVDQLMREGIFEPLGMHDTTPPLNAALPEPVLHSYTDERGVWEEATFWNPTWTNYAGGMGSNQEDLRTFLEALGEGDLVSEESHELQFAPATVGLGENTEAAYYGMGMAVANGWIFANPRLQGYSGAFGYLPGEQLSIVVYTTRSQQAPDQPYATQLAEGVSSIFVPDQPIKLPSRS